MRWFACGNEGLHGAVLYGAHMCCCSAVGNGGWDGAVEDSTLDGLRVICDVA